MSWTYSDWRSQATAPLRLARLRLHMAEITDQIGKERGSDGHNESSSANVELLRMLQEQETKLMQDPGVMNAGGVSRIRLGRVR